MTCIFVAVYFFYYYFSISPEERNPLGHKRHFALSFARIAVFSLIALAICAALLITTYYSRTFGKTEFTNPNYSFSQKFDWADMISKFYFGSYDTVRPEGLPWLYSGMLTLILAPLYFFAPHIKTREKISTGILVAFFFLSFNGSTIDIFWHGMQKPNWLNYRYSFMLCFILILMAYKAFERLADIGYRKVAGMCGIIAGIIVIIQKLELEFVDDLRCVWASLAICAIYLAVLRASTLSDVETRKTAAMVLSILCTLEMFCAGLLNVIALDADVVFSSRTSYQNFANRVSPVVEKIKEQDTSFYRMEKTVHRKTNDPYLLDMNGLSGSTSTLNKETITLLNKMGISAKAHWTKYLGGTPVLDSLFGIKYLITVKDNAQPLYDYMFTYDEDLAAYENPYALSIAYGVDPMLRDFDMLSEDMYSPFTRMNGMIAAMLGKEEPVNIFKVQEVSDVTTTNATTSSIANHTKILPQTEGVAASITYTMTITDSDILYCYFPSDYTRECDLYVNGEKKAVYYDNETYRILKLGTFDVGETVTVKLTLKDQNLYIRENVDFFCYVDEEAFKEYMPLLAGSQFEIDNYTESKFEGTINIKDGNELVFTSIAYDEGWQVYVDGEKVEKVKLIGGTIGFDCPEGQHDLVLKYRPTCMYIGIAISVAGFVAFVLLWIIEGLWRKEQLQAGRDVYCPIYTDYESFSPDETAYSEALEADTTQKEEN